MALRDRAGLGLGQAAGMLVRQLVLQRALVECRGFDQVGADADLRQQIQAARRGRGEDQRRRGGRGRCPT